jgi:membrane protease YdiL (CAAX protease family)
VTQDDIEAGLILLIVPVVLLVWVYYGKRTVFERLLAQGHGRGNLDVKGVICEYLGAFLLMFGVPFLVATLVFERHPRELGLQMGDMQYGGWVLAVALPVALLVAYLGSADRAMQSEYPLAQSVIGQPRLFLIVEVFYLVYYVGWEFLFRGFMLFGLCRRYDALLAVLVQMIPSALVHIGKPAAESFAAILAGILFGYIALEAQSIVYPLILHATVGISTDVFVALRMRTIR